MYLVMDGGEEVAWWCGEVRPQQLAELTLLRKAR